MKERPILFSAPMVRAILDGRKTQTRRVIEPPPMMVADHATRPWQGSPEQLMSLFEQLGRKCPYGRPGDRLWVREAYRTSFQYDHIKPRDLPVARTKSTLAVPFWYDADLYGDLTPLHPGLGPGKYRPGMFMPRAASRILLEITAMRVERLQDISPADCIAEGYQSPPGTRYAQEELATLDWYRELWESINGAGSWQANPWVWVVEFTRVEVAA
ncbi:hypothetical protein [Chitiniphilus eburneus]|uniref:Morphogenetic protein n=1 Tax=Chitiniphilus eburneus TaxID=2571148 RepID=A0A4U0Q3P4_9NEIS|nr:hypothetical protein [Chitiniphilus eburneus]TJZ75609.1 hypothetical protein FAZ21_06760 [Chitiniphilus eburneus]